ncbi:MAG: hypothetical protein QF464_23755, partial [Myxococcota bacterium]|nr:hypothetical protein [Myxococcota bacterium]
MSDGSHDDGPKGPHSPSEMVNAMPLTIAQIRQRLAGLDAKLDGVDDHLVRIAGDDPNATEEIQLTPGMRAQIAHASVGLDDTDTQLPAVSLRKAALAEVDAALDAFGGAGDTEGESPGRSAQDPSHLQIDTIPEMPPAPGSSLPGAHAADGR